MDWRNWRAHFEANATRPLPALEAGLPELDPEVRVPLADSLARFQVGEAGEGRIAHQIDRVHYTSIDDDYRAALKRFVAEEGRHGRILALLVRELGGKLMPHTWTERLFVFGRRLVGVRLKLLVLLAAEVVGIGFYGAVADRVRAGSLRDALRQICGDEEKHLDFHVAFFRAECSNVWKRLLFRPVWWAVCTLAALLVAHDHKPALRALRVDRAWMLRRFVQLIREVDVAVLAAAPALGDHGTRAPPASA